MEMQTLIIGIITNDFLVLILPRIYGETLRGHIIYLHKNLYYKMVSIPLNLCGRWRFQLILIIDINEYQYQISHDFIPPYNMNDLPMVVLSKSTI